MKVDDWMNKVATRSRNAAQVFDDAYVQGLQLGYDAAYAFADKGHIHLAAPRDGLWQDIHTWCESAYGEGNYSWSGNTFGFRTDEEATMFQMRW